MYFKELEELKWKVDNGKVGDDELFKISKDLKDLKNAVKNRREHRYGCVSIFKWLETKPDVKKRAVNDVYEDYLGFCKDYCFKPESKIMLTKHLYIHHDIEVKVTSIKGKSCRIYS